MVTTQGRDEPKSDGKIVELGRFMGNVDIAAGTTVKGWCCGLNGELANVQLRINGKLAAQFPALAHRKDLSTKKISEVGGFQFDIASFVPNHGDVKVTITDESGVTLRGGSFVIDGKSLARGHLSHTLQGLSTTTIGVFGDVPYAVDLSRGSVLSKILNLLETRVLERTENDGANIWFTHPHYPKPPQVKMINGRFIDAAKSAIDIAHREVFDRGVCVEAKELKPGQRYVVKSETQAAHDGIVKTYADITPSDFDGKVVQRLIDNTIDKDTVLDIRVPYIGGDIPFAYLKTRSISDRFSNGNKSAHVTFLSNVLSDPEVVQIKAFCTALNLDYGELDVLRDSDSGDIWIVDVNNTPSGPPNGLSKGEADFAVREMALLFYRRFLAL